MQKVNHVFGPHRHVRCASGQRMQNTLTSVAAHQTDRNLGDAAGRTPRNTNAASRGCRPGTISNRQPCITDATIARPSMAAVVSQIFVPAKVTHFCVGPYSNFGGKTLYTDPCSLCTSVVLGPPLRLFKRDTYASTSSPACVLHASR